MKLDFIAASLFMTPVFFGLISPSNWIPIDCSFSVRCVAQADQTEPNVCHRDAVLPPT